MEYQRTINNQAVWQNGQAKTLRVSKADLPDWGL